jgi:hypothetical protein
MRGAINSPIPVPPEPDVEPADDMLLMAVISERISLKDERMSLFDAPLLFDGVLVLERP